MLLFCADQRQANVTTERPSTTTGVTGADGSRDSPSPSSLTTSTPPPRRRSSPPLLSSSDRAGVHRPHSVDVDLLPPRPRDNGVVRENGLQLPQHVIQRPTSGHVTSPDTESKMRDESAVGGGVVRYDSVRFDQRQTAVDFQQQLPGSQFFRASQYISPPHPPASSSSSSYGVDSSTVQHHHHQQPQQQSSSSYPLSYGYDVVAGDTRWMLHGQYPRTAFRPGVDFAAAGYSGSGGLVGNAAPTPARRATVEYRAQPTTTADPVLGAGVYSMDYPSLNFPALQFQATAAYGKQNY